MSDPVSIRFTRPLLPKGKRKVRGGATSLVLFTTDSTRLLPLGSQVDDVMGGRIRDAIRDGVYRGKPGETLVISAPTNANYQHVIIAGLGNGRSIDAVRMNLTAGRVVERLQQLGATDAAFTVEVPRTSPLDEVEMGLAMAEGAVLKSYRFDKYRTTLKPEDKPRLHEIRVTLNDPEEAERRFAPRLGVLQGVRSARDLVSEPGNIIYPESFAERCKELSALGVEVEVLAPAQIRKLGMGALMGVAQGSAQEPRVVVMQWSGGDKKKKSAPIAFIGKGVTFDSGGISIKPSASMEDMKWDMAGGAAVAGLMEALARRKAKASVVAVIGLVENMPDGNAQRPGDVVTSMSGQTVEVINTDAEGRLVLADVLWYAKERFKPAFMVDLATLTGAILVALGESRGGLFSNDDKLAQRLLDAAEETGEPLWRMPMGEDYDALINSQIADMKNVSDGRWAGSITAAHFLKRFVGDTPWAHLDIAGVSWSSKGNSLSPRGATGFGVRLLDRLVSDHYERG